MTLETRNVVERGETRRFDKGEISVVELPGATVGRAVMQPGWQWSKHVKPIVQTDSCQEAHTMYVLQGRLRVRMDDGTEGEIQAGEAGVISPGHDAWVVGDEPYVAIDWSGAAAYAKTES